MASAKVKNDWLGYLDRSFSQIKTSLLNRLGISNPEMSDHSPTNPLIVFLDMFSGIGEMLGYYIDNMAEEAYAATAQRTSSVVRHSQAIDYRIRARAPEMVEIRIDWSIAAPTGFVIPAGASIVSTKESILYQTLENISIPPGATVSYLPMAQVTDYENNAFAVSTGVAGQKINLGTSYMHRTSELIIGGEQYEEVESWAGELPDAKVYVVNILEDGNAYATLGDNINGLIPPAAQTIAVKYFSTLGAAGKVGAAGFDNSSIDLGIALPGALAIDDANSQLSSSGGTDYEDIEKIRKNAPRSLRTLERMVTTQDHKDIMEMVPGVNKAAVKFNCGKKIYLYIAPDGGGIAPTLLINRAQSRAEETKMVGTFPVVRPAGESSLVLGITVFAKKRKSVSATHAQVMNALLEFGSIDNQEINGAIRLSDIYGLVDNLPNVEYMDLTRLYTLPYARPTNHTNPLVWTSTTTESSTVKVRWRVDYDGSQVRVFKDGNFIQSIPLGLEYDDTPSSGVKFTITDAGYSAGNSWEFTTYPYKQNVNLDDFTVLTIKEADVQLIINELPSTQI